MIQSYCNNIIIMYITQYLWVLIFLPSQAAITDNIRRKSQLRYLIFNTISAPIFLKIIRFEQRHPRRCGTMNNHRKQFSARNRLLELFFLSFIMFNSIRETACVKNIACVCYCYTTYMDKVGVVDDIRSE